MIYTYSVQMGTEPVLPTKPQLHYTLIKIIINVQLLEVAAAQEIQRGVHQSEGQWFNPRLLRSAG